MLIGLGSVAAGFFLFAQNSIVIDHPSASTTPAADLPINADIPPQARLSNPPDVIKAIYATSWAVSSEKKLKYLLDLIDTTEINAIVIDVKDFSGYIAYNTDLELPKKYDAVELRMPTLNRLIKRLHDKNIYIIGRVSIFQDVRLALARPDLALYSSTTGEVWKDRKGITWMDSTSREVWDYNIAVAKEILARGFDEANFDYIRFASDGNMSDIKYPIWDSSRLKVEEMKDFYAYVREQIPYAPVSADLFGLTTINTDGLGIGQHLEYALPSFDAVAPMTYPSHYASGFIGLTKPAEHPYEVLKYSMVSALARAKQLSLVASTTPIGKLRPWIQDFDLGADYDAQKVRAQIQAWDDAAVGSPEFYGGWMIWSPSNVYTRGALLTE